ncbi:Lipoprotein [Methylacidimicrobium sp. AP8]|uniref:XdhC family protein n=1 Tax=Methylacidimicrobium sp. AP8 TaxID=2730359 RepID=UPI0018C0C70E|nr:XdhC family protein [Methylacidimicrobium sp. AP8]CAB4242765.1 Lipoprotein [Methylacidimicrobium sp. AP8]
MDSANLAVLRQALEWHRAGFGVVLATIAHSAGPAPRPPGALWAVRSDGLSAGSVGGGCVEEEWIGRVRAGEALPRPAVVEFGPGSAEAGSPRLPCGGTLRVVFERIGSGDWIEEVLARTADRRPVARSLELADGAVGWREAGPAETTRLEEGRLVTIFGPPLRLLLIGAGEIARCLAAMAQPLGYEVLLCEPREALAPSASLLPGVRRLPGLPDEAVAAVRPDPRTAVVALSHDPALDDMALLAALPSAAFYVGALGSRAHAERRRRRLAPYFLPGELDRLSSPVGLDLGGRQPGEIAAAILAELIAVKNGRLSGNGTHRTPSRAAARELGVCPDPA